MANYIPDPRTAAQIASMNSQHAGASRRPPPTVYEPYYHNGNPIEQLIASVLMADKKPYQPDYIADPTPRGKGPLKDAPPASMSDMQAAILKRYIPDPRTAAQIASMQGRKDKRPVGFANTSANQAAPSNEQAMIAALTAQVFGSPFNNVAPPQLDPAIDRSGIGDLGQMTSSLNRQRLPTELPTVSDTASLPPNVRDARLRNSDRLAAQYPGAEAHAAEIARSRDFSRSLDQASDYGETGVRQGVMDEIAEKFPDKAYRPGTVVVGGGDLSHITRRAPPQLFRGGVSAAISGLGAPMNDAQSSALNKKLAEREAGIRAYESQTGPRAGQDGATRDTIERNRTRNLLEGRGYIPDKRAEYLLQQRDNESTRNRALAAAQQYIQSQPTALMRLEDYRDPQGAFERRMQERAFGVQESRYANEAADRADALGLQRENLASRERMHGDTLSAQERRDADQANRQREMFELEQRIADKRQLDAEAREEKTYQRRTGESDKQFEQRFRKEMELQAKNRETELEILDRKLKAESGKELDPVDQLEAEIIGNDPNMSTEEKLAHAARLQQKRRGALAQPGTPTLPPGVTATTATPQGTPQYPNLQKELETIGKDATSFEAFVEQMFGLPAATDSPGERKVVEQYARRRYGDAAVDKWMAQEAYDGGFFGNIRKSYQDRMRKQNRRRSAVFGLEPNKIKNPYYNQGLLNAGDEYLESY